LFIKDSEKTAIAWHEDKISYRRLLQNINYYSSLFAKNEEGKAAIYSPNRPEWVYAFYSIWKNQSIAVPIDFMSTVDEVAYILNDCRPEVIFISNETKNSFANILPLLNYSLTVFNLDEISDKHQQYSAEEIGGYDVTKTAIIVYTSGTTGTPKGVMLSYDNLLSNIEAVSEHISIYSESRNVLALLPFHHILPLMGTVIIPLKVHTTIGFSPSMVSEDIISTLQKNNISIIIGVPRLYAAIRKGVMDKINSNGVAKALFRIAHLVNSQSFSKKIFKKVHDKFGGKVAFMVCGGAKLDEDMANDYKTLGFEMLEGFGMTEAAPMITFTRPGRWKIGSPGEVMPGLEIKIVDGEIAAKGRNIMKGYYNRPEETAQVIKDGWLYTGDLGDIDDEGFLHITGRSKEIIILSNGKNINPEEVEKKILAVSNFVAEAGVFMQNDQLNAALFPNYKVLREEGVLNLEEKFRWEVVDKYNRSAAPHKKITKFILFKEELPKTRLGKIQRFKLAEVTEGQKSKKNKTSEPQFEEYIVIRDFLKEQKKTEIYPDDHIEIDLGLDSLDKVSFQTFLESTFGIKIPEDTFLQHPTVEKLSRFMKEKKNKLSVEAVKWAEILKEKVDLKLPKSWFTQNLLKNASKVLFKIYFRIKSEGTENLQNGPFILVPNHQSFYDGLFVSVFLKNKIMKNTYFYAKEKHVKFKWLKSFANRNNVIVMDINRDLKESIQKLAEVLRKGKNIIIFPEGTRTYTGEVGEFKKTFAILSSELNVPIVPVTIKGANEALPRGSIIPKPWKKINVKFHKPVYPNGMSYDMISEMVQKLIVSDLR